MHCALASSTPTMISLCLRVQSDSARSGPTSTGLSFWLQKFWAQDWRDGLEVKSALLEDPSSSLSNHMVAHKLSVTTVAWDPTPLHRHKYRQNTNAYKINF